MAEFSPPTIDPSIYNYGDFFNNVAQGYKLAQMPQQMRNQSQSDALNLAILKNKVQYEPQMSQADLQAKLLQNKNAEMTNKYLPQDEAAKQALLRAQTQKENQPANPSGEYFGLLQYYNSLPPGQEKDMTKQRLDMLTSRGNGTTVYGENGQPMVQIGGSTTNPPQTLSDKGQPYYQTDETTGQPVLDKEGKPIQEGIMRPATADELKEKRGRYIFNDLYPELNNSLSYYSGKDSWKKFKNDLDTMNTNPESRQHVIDYFSAQKILPAVIAKEQQTLGASNTLGQFRALQEKMNSSDIPKLLQQYSGFVMPPDVMKISGDNLNKRLNDVTEGSFNNISGFVKVPFEDKKNTKSTKSSASQEDPFVKYPVVTNG